MTIAALRTPEDRFATLPDWPYTPQYIDDLAGYEGLRMADCDEYPSGPARETSLKAVSWWASFTGPSFMAVGAADPVLGPATMATVRARINGCPEPLVIPEGGRFVQEWGEPIARAALAQFGGA